jgi:tyrosinase
VLDDADFGQPYWDWASDGELPPGQQSTAHIWAYDYWVAGFLVSTGPFRDGQWQVNIEEAFVPSSLTPVLVSANRPLRQALGTDVSNLPTKEEVRRAVLRGQPNVAYDTAPWDCNSASFRNELEGWWPDAPNLHNRVHVWVRGIWGRQPRQMILCSFSIIAT